MMSDGLDPASREFAIQEEAIVAPLRFSEPIIMGVHPEDSSSGASEQFHNGTATLVEIGGRPLIITCDHVIAAFEHIKRTNPACLCQIAEQRLDPLLRMIDRDPLLDLAVMDGTDLHFERQRKGMDPLQTYRATQWPPSRVEAGEVVCFGGFPEAYTRNTGDEVVLGGLGIAATRVTDADDRRLISELDRALWRTLSGRRLDETLGLRNLSGVSGGPVMRLGPLRFELVAIVKELGEHYDILRAVQMSRLNEDGTIRRV
jgi:hypothetical protein